MLVLLGGPLNQYLWKPLFRHFVLAQVHEVCPVNGYLFESALALVFLRILFNALLLFIVGLQLAVVEKRDWIEVNLLALPGDPLRRTGFLKFASATADIALRLFSTAVLDVRSFKYDLAHFE